MCTAIRFTDNNGNLYFGRNLDWSFSYGERVLITPQGFRRPRAFPDKDSPDTGRETSPFNIIGMGIVGEGFPLYFDCANDAGLAIAGLNFPGYARYEDSPIEGKTNIAAYEFPLWVTSNFATVDEAASTLENVALVAQPLSDRYPVSMLHWIIADSTRSIVVEYLADGMHVHDNGADVLANQPDYAWHHENLRNYLSLTSDFPEPVQWSRAKLTAYGSGSGMRGLPGDYYSPSRFVRAAFLNAHYPTQNDEPSNVSRLFHTLTGVAMIDGAARMADGDYERTVYTGGYSQATKTYYWSTYENPAIRSTALSEHNLENDQLILV